MRTVAVLSATGRLLSSAVAPIPSTCGFAGLTPAPTGRWSSMRMPLAARVFGSGSSSRTATRRRSARRTSRSTRLRPRADDAARGIAAAGSGDAVSDAIRASGEDQVSERASSEGGFRRVSEAEKEKAERGTGPHLERDRREVLGDELPFATTYHVPVVCKEVVEWLITNPEGMYVDCTLGGGGHSAALLSSLGRGARVVGLDRDPDALEEASRRLVSEVRAGRFQAMHSNFAEIGTAVRECELLRSPLEPGPGEQEARAFDSRGPGRAPSHPTNAHRTREVPLVDGILVDLGVSSHQIDDGQRGFSFSSDGPLDMRMERVSLDTASGADGRGSASDVVNFAEEREIREMIWRYGEEKRSSKIARAIVENRPILTTGQFAEVVGRCAPFNQRTKTLARVFQALRIEVNGELNALESLLEQAKDVVKPGGRLLILSYHSLEDRRVKRVFATGNLQGKVVKDFYGHTISPWKPLLRKPMFAGEAEVALNPRARSVRLRVAERTHAV